jgi:hypothetical protein
MQNDMDFVDVMVLHFCIETCCHHGNTSPKEYVRLEVWFHAFLTLTLVGDEWSAQSPVLTVERMNSERKTIKACRLVLMPCREMMAIFVLRNLREHINEVCGKNV